MKDVDVKKVKEFKVKICFDSVEANIFGGLSHSGLSIVIDEGSKDKLLEEFLNQVGKLTVNMVDGSLRVINISRILFIDVVEIIPDEQTNSQEQG